MIRNFDNYGYFLLDIEEEKLKPVIDEVSKIKSNLDLSESISEIVDGHITGTYRLKDSIASLESIVMPYFIQYNNHYNYINRNYSCLTSNLYFTMNHAWVSFQNKFDFNPAHTHPGLMSFVLWLDIPYSREDEIKHSPGKSGKNRSGSFTMYYTNILGNVETEDILLDHTFKNKMIIFPAKIKHSVQPFYSSDCTRISVAGNIFFRSESTYP
jgi:hypothetical protein